MLTYVNHELFAVSGVVSLFVLFFCLSVCGILFMSL